MSNRKKDTYITDKNSLENSRYKYPLYNKTYIISVLLDVVTILYFYNSELLYNFCFEKINHFIVIDKNYRENSREFPL